MPFVHGKNASLYLRDVQNKWRVVSMFVSDITFPTKIDTPETTTFGKGAKTVVPGIRDATFQVKGYFDSASILTAGTTGPAGPGVIGYAGMDVLLGGLMGYQPTNGFFGPYTQIATGVFTQAAPNSTAPAVYTLNADGTLATYGGVPTGTTLTAGQTLPQIIFGPEGDGGYLGSTSGSANTYIGYSNCTNAQLQKVKYAMDGVLMDYSITIPVKGIVGFSATWQVNGPFVRDNTAAVGTSGPAIAWPQINSTT